MNPRLPLLTLVPLAVSCTMSIAQDFDAMPLYAPQQHVTGTIRIRGDEHQALMLRNWEQAFHRYQPDVSFDDRLTSTVHGIPALVFDVADLGLLGREIAPLENLSFRRMFKYDPLEITVATGSFDTQYEAYALGVFVNKENPISRVTFSQLAAIFGCGSGKDIRTWGQLGLTGEWADKPIHVLGYPTDNNIAAFFALKVLEGGAGQAYAAQWSALELRAQGVLQHLRQERQAGHLVRRVHDAGCRQR
jgi:phosphate transport system substrate-binding protein